MIPKLTNLQALGGPEIEKLTAKKFNKLLTYQRPLVLTGNSVVVWNLSKGYNVELTLTTNKSLFFEQLTPGDYGTIKLIQDATGSRTLTLPVNSKVAGGGAGVLTLSTSPNAIDIATFYYDGLNLFWNISLNFN